jgi:HAE1 family hydrophobic/amphiphilic exporter-1
MTMVVCAMMVFGMLSFFGLGVNYFPIADIPIVTVVTVLRGASPEIIETRVTDKIEEVINTISGVKKINSVSVDSVSQVIVEFEMSKKIDIATQDIRDKIASIRRDLPEDIESPLIDKIDIGAASVMTFVLSSGLPIQHTTKYAKDVLKQQLQKASGVGSVKILGGQERQICVWLSLEKMMKYSITVNDVCRALQVENIEIPGGKIQDGRKEIVVKVKGEIEKVEDFKDLYIGFSSGYAVRLADVARIEDGVEELKSLAILNGKKAVALEIYKQSGTNTVKVIDAVKKEAKKLTETLPGGMKLEVVKDTSRFVKQSIDEVMFHLLYGGLFAIITVFIFLRSFSMTLIAAVALPTSVITTFAIMKYLNFTFNMLSMLALSLSIGMLIDDAIVVLENIHRHHVEEKKKIRAAALFATDEIGLAVLATTFTIVAVFVPVAFMKGLVGQFFYEFGLTVAGAVLVSLFISFTMTPMLCSRYMRAGHKKHGIFYRAVEYVLKTIENIYTVLLRVSLKSKFMVILASLALLGGSFWMAGKLKGEFKPDEDNNEFNIVVETASGSSIERTAEVASKIEKLISGDRHVVNVYTSVAGDAQEKANQAVMYVGLVSLDKRPERGQMEIMTEWRKKLSGITEARVTLEIIPPATISGGERECKIKYLIRGPNLDKINEYADAIINEIKNIKGIVDIDKNYKPGKPETRVHIDRIRAARLGVPVASLAMATRIMIGGDDVSKFKDGSDQYDINVRLESGERSSPSDINNLFIRSMSGKMVDFKNIVNIEDNYGPSQINRTNRQKQVKIFADIEGLSLSEAVDKINELTKKLDMSPEYSAMFEGDAERMQDTLVDMTVAMLLAVAFIYMILASQFENFIHPLTIMVSLPFSFIGAFGGMLLFDKTLNVFSFIGLIMLMGLVTKNAILLIDYIITLRSRGMMRYDAIIKSGQTRLRPILMTTLAMIAGMMPLAIGKGAGSETRSPMAVCIIGGLLTSTLLTLVVVPVVYTIFDDISTYLFGKGRERRSIDDEDNEEEHRREESDSHSAM